MVLIGSDGGEGSFGEDERPELGTIHDVVQSTNCHVRASAADDVNTRLVLVHRVEYDLQPARHAPSSPALLPPSIGAKGQIPLGPVPRNFLVVV